jgi:hypothetical protein
MQEGAPDEPPAASRGVSLKVKLILSQPRWAGFPLRYNKRRGIKPCRFRITLKVIRVIRIICEIGGLKIDSIGKKTRIGKPDGRKSGFELIGPERMYEALKTLPFLSPSVALNVPPDKLAAEADSVSFCLSKGLAAPVSSVVCLSYSTPSEWFRR